MKRIIIWILLVLLVTAMAYGFFRKKLPSNQVKIIKSEELNIEEINTNIIKKLHKEDYKKHNEITDDIGILQQHTVFQNKNVFYLSYFEEFVEGNNGNFVLEGFDKDGVLVWQRKWLEIEISELPMGTEPVLDDKLIYIGVSGNLYALKMENGDMVWASNNTGSSTLPIVHKEAVYISDYESTLLTSIDKNDGTINWSLSNNSDMLCPVKSWIWKDSIIVACETLLPGQLRYITFDLDGEILDYRDYARHESPIQFFLTESSLDHENEKNGYSPNNVFDGDVKTSWFIENNVKGQWLRFDSEYENIISVISIYNGDHGDYNKLKKNGKAKSIRIDFSNGDYLVYNFKNRGLMDLEKIIFSKLVVAYKMKITMLDSTSNNLSISEVVIN